MTIHDAAFADHPECFSTRFATWYNWLIPRLTRRASGVITVSEFSKSRLVEVCQIDPEKIHVIPNGIDQSFKRADADQISTTRAKYQIGGEYILGVGSLEPRKNLHALLSAWRIVHRSCPELKLVIAGHADRKRFADIGVVGNEHSGVVWIGYVPDAQLSSLYSGASAFVYPSIYEGFGLPPLEAMACGTPVICSNSTSLPEVVSDAAELFDPVDPEAIASATLGVLNCSNRRDHLRRVGPLRAAAFTWEKTAEQTRLVLENAAAAS